MNNVKIPKFFMSHHRKDRELLSVLKRVFLNHGIELFLAHEDIPGGEEYIEKIKDELRNCDIFIIYANDNSKNSSFCNQEIGWSLVLNKPFIIIGDKDWDLMPKQQSYKLKPGKEFECFSSIMRDKRTIKAISQFAQYKKKSSALKVLAKMNYSGFRVHSKAPSKLSDKWIHLIPHAWNDYWFYTEFDVNYTINRQKIELSYKIGYRGQIGGNPSKSSYTSKEMSEYFLWLPDNFLSRQTDGTGDTNVDTAISILLRDCEYDGSLKKGFENEDVFKRSLFLGELNGNNKLDESLFEGMD